jgi:hypothetical protein
MQSTPRFGDQDARALEQQSRYVTTAGRGHQRDIRLWREFRLVGVGACAVPSGLICALALAA